MKFKHLTYIINPVSGKQEPILSMISHAMEDSDLQWEVEITKKDRSAAEIATRLIGKTDMLVVYGGDGTVTEVASALRGTSLPMAILPGGTANVMAKELGIPQDSIEALRCLHEGAHQFRKVDMGMMNGTPFMLRVNLGIMADMVIGADPELKDKVGQLAYGIAAIQTLSGTDAVDYHLEIDGTKMTHAGVSLTVTNSGNIGIGEFALQPGISIDDGLLDVLLMKDSSLLSVLKIAGSTILQSHTEALVHYKCKRITISMNKSYRFICDDHEEEAKEIEISVLPAAINILIPITSM
jgi:YegS/Rv2252/BmrU family lipid kinase